MDGTDGMGGRDGRDGREGRTGGRDGRADRTDRTGRTGRTDGTDGMDGRNGRDGRDGRTDRTDRTGRTGQTARLRVRVLYQVFATPKIIKLEAISENLAKLCEKACRATISQLHGGPNWTLRAARGRVGGFLAPFAWRLPRGGSRQIEKS